MNKISWGRLFIGGLIAAVILFLTDGFLHENLVKEYWQYLYQGLGGQPPPAHNLSMVYFFIFELGRAFAAMLFYVLMRPFYGAGPKTAVISAIMAWFVCSVTGPAEFIPLGFYGRRLWVVVAGFQFVTSIVANLIAAWIYRDPVTAATPAE